MNKNTFLLALGLAGLSIVFAPQASAGCGRQLASRFTVVVPGANGRNLPSAVAEEASPVSASAIRGLWLTDVVLDDQVIFQAYESFTSDGLEFLNDNGSTLEGNVCFGAWTVAPRNTVKVYHPSWNYDMGGNLIGTVIIRSEITVNAGGNTFRGTVTVDTYDLNGIPAGPELQAQLTGKRIVAN